MTQAGVP